MRFLYRPALSAVKHIANLAFLNSKVALALTCRGLHYANKTYVVKVNEEIVVVVVVGFVNVLTY